MKVIYHIHDQCCGHAGNTLESIIKTSLAQGYKELFLTEHCPLDNNNIIFRPSREDITDLRKRINIANKKYVGKLLIHFGFEAEYSKWNTSYFDNFKNDPQCDYLIFGNHYLGDMWKNPRLVMDLTKSAADLDEYYENSKLAVEKGIFSLFAHPDIFLQSYKKWDKKAQWVTHQIIMLCEKYNMPLGFNANGMYFPRNGFNYPSEYFWKEVSKSNIKVIVEADAHFNKTLDREWLNKVHDEAIKYGLVKNLVDTIKIIYFR